MAGWSSVPGDGEEVMRVALDEEGEEERDRADEQHDPVDSGLDLAGRTTTDVTGHDAGAVGRGLLGAVVGLLVGLPWSVGCAVGLGRLDVPGAVALLPLSVVAVVAVVAGLGVGVGLGDAGVVGAGDAAGRSAPLARVVVACSVGPTVEGSAAGDAVGEGAVDVFGDVGASGSQANEGAPLEGNAASKTRVTPYATPNDTIPAPIRRTSRRREPD